MKIVEIKNVTKTYGFGFNSFKALDKISLSVEKGEFVAIMGSSGSGKSTLLHIIGGVDKPTYGSVTVNGQDLLEKTNEELSLFRCCEIGLVYQFFNLISVLNVEENITLPTLLAGREIDHKRVDMLIRMLGLEKKINELPNQLSGGQQQRVAIGRALVNSPSIILADEPTGNLDSKTGNEILEFLKRSNKELKQTLILVTHDDRIAAQADRIIKIEDGRIVSETVNAKMTGGDIS